ncbi:MAG: 16S rRNA (uracil(1498)-N(3))-methyltransferase [Prevotellaceae bacterium]|jgi:16S rRNA (uracil1498-N3)-methyltransferase|nr:16S rRNA (uracil(1498)-N(3))-methyltransferase [Prevotellaceae bacterium]
MEHLFYAPDIASNPELPEDESQHCARVLRLGNGDAITVTDGKGFLYKAILTDAHPKHCRIDIEEKLKQKPSWDFDIHIAISPTKNMDRMEWFVEKATEIGINRITCLRCRYSERSEIKLQRLYRIAVSAMKQSQKTTLPEIDEIIDFPKFIVQNQTRAGYKMIGHCSEMKKNLIKEIYKPGENAVILIGPEGDFSPKEISAAISAGFSPVSLGESRLRTETAALIACHTLHVLNQ